MELPPRARRILCWGVNPARRIGTTSACAENTLRNWPLDTQLRNYLRVRGEYADSNGPAITGVELPPRARRIPGRTLEFPKTNGTTSACAENTSYPGSLCAADRNYLRVRGEYGVTTCTESFCWELPPRARRIRFQPYKPWGLDGTTSACAENTPILCRFQTTIRNYLRVRGEYHNSVVSNKPAAELPPRARRILALGIECFDTHGTTSACAENTVHNRKFWCRFRNYLRVRGEYLCTVG